MRFDRHDHQNRSIALRYRVGLAAAMLLVGLAGAGTARADGWIGTDAPPLSMLVKFDDRQYEIAYSRNISLEPTSSAIVRKIGYGRAVDVNIATTSTGTYSSDGLTSPHVLYPGIAVSRVYEDTHHHEPAGPGFSIFSLGSSPLGGVTLNAVSDRGVRSCLARGSFVSCFRTY